MSTPDRFELGFCLGGSISAGAYLAGVMDFLLEALDAWEAAKKNGENVPRHDVSIKVITGASGGGMTAGIMGAIAHRNIPPIRTDADAAAFGSKNPLYDSWVKQIDMEKLLNTDDIKLEKKLVSLLDSTVLNKIALTAFQTKAEPANRSFISDELHILMTLTNLRGVPYRIDMTGEAKQGQDMVIHADYMHFVVSKQQKWPKGAYYLDPFNFSGTYWEWLRNAALGSGAFPIGLAPRLVSRRPEDYGERLWAIPKEKVEGGEVADYLEIHPCWPVSIKKELEGKNYNFWTIDGGTMNNEPLELTRTNLSGKPGLRNPREPHRVNRMTILVDPFVGSIDETFIDPKDKKEKSVFTDPGEESPGVIKVLMKMFGSLMNQTRFKPEELALAQDENIYSRFLVAPLRADGATILKSPKAIACGSLGGFGGFLDESFRHHDFMLGRRNCQQFLRKHFALPISKTGDNNPVFKENYHAASAMGFVFEDDGVEYYPIIPLVNDVVSSPVPVPPWPAMPAAKSKLINGKIESRAKAVIAQLVNDAKKIEGAAFWVGILAGLGQGIAVTKVVDLAKKKIREGLRAHDLWGATDPNAPVQKKKKGSK